MLLEIKAINDDDDDDCVGREFRYLRNKVVPSETLYQILNLENYATARRLSRVLST